MLLPYPAHLPTKHTKIGSFTQNPCNTQLPSTIQIQSTLLASFQYAGRLVVHTETRALGMYKNCTKKEALKLAYEHMTGKVGERWSHTQSQP